MHTNALISRGFGMLHLPLTNQSIAYHYAAWPSRAQAVPSLGLLSLFTGLLRSSLLGVQGPFHGVGSLAG